MEKFKFDGLFATLSKYKLLSAALGMSGGWFSLSNCTGNSCGSCFRCAGAGIVIFLILIFGRFKNFKNSASESRSLFSVNKNQPDQVVLAGEQKSE